MGWYFEENNGNIFIVSNGMRAKDSRGLDFGRVISVEHGNNADQIKFNFENEELTRLLRENYCTREEPDLFELKKTTSNAEFISALCKASNVVTKIKKRSNDASDAKAKRSKVTPDGEDQPSMIAVPPADISAKCTGSYEVPIAKLSTPPKHLLCRSISRPWVDEIKKKLVLDPMKNVTSLSCMIKPEVMTDRGLFKGEHVENYSMFTLGGNHLRTAAKELKEEGNLPYCIEKLEVNVYVGLSDEEALRLGNIHNEKVKSLPMSFYNYCDQARKLLYKLSALDANKDDPPPKGPQEFRASFLRQIAKDSEKTQGAYCTVYHVARYTRRCWSEFEKICKDYEKGWTPGKKPKQLKQTPFQPLQGLSEPEIFNLLEQVTSSTISLKQLAGEARKVKKMDSIRKSFVENVSNISSWGEALKKFPHHTGDDVLAQFLDEFKVTYTPNQKTSPHFQNFCRAAENRTQKAHQLELTFCMKEDGQVVKNDELETIIEKYKEKIINEYSLSQSTKQQESDVDIQETD